MGHFGVFVLMAIESSFIPFPSELVIPPAAYLAYQGEMNIYLVVVMGILGSLVGATINYYLAMWLGRPLIYSLTEKKFAKFILLDSKKVAKAEKYFLKYGNISTFIGRLIPVIRQLISLPAGFSGMNLKSFLFYTFLGSGAWVIILALQGYLIGVYSDFFKEYIYEVVFGVAGVAVIVYLFIRFFRRKK